MRMPTKPLELPAVQFPIVYHVGSRPRQRKQAGLDFGGWQSEDGDTLSVSLEPAAWRRRIGSRLRGKPTWALVRRDGKPGTFLAMGKLSSRLRTLLLTAAVEMRFVVPGTVYILASGDYEQRWYDDRDEALDALEGAKELRVKNPRLKARPGWLPLPSLLDRFGYTDPKLWLVPDFAILMVVETLKLFDGLWWSAATDPDPRSKLKDPPRGGIFQSRLPAWTAQQMKK